MSNDPKNPNTNTNTNAPAEAETLPTDAELEALDVEPAGEAPPVLIPVTTTSKPKKSHKKKKPPKGAAPDVPPPPSGDFFSPPPPFEGGPPAQDFSPSNDPDVGPPSAPVSVPKKTERKKRAINPRQTAQKICVGADKIAHGVASARYKNRDGAPLLMPAAVLAAFGFKGVNPQSSELVPISEAAKMTDDERSEIEDGIAEVLEESPIFVTGPQALLFTAVVIYGQKIWAMESIATSLYKKPNGDNT